MPTNPSTPISTGLKGMTTWPHGLKGRFSMTTKYLSSAVGIVYAPGGVVADSPQKLSYRLYQAGYRHILNVDFSETVISRMSARHSADCPEMEWKVMILSLQLTPRRRK